MKVAHHNDLTTLHGLRYHLTFAHAGVTKSVRRVIRVLPCGDGYIASALDIFKINEISAGLRDPVPADILEEVRTLRAAAEMVIAERDRASSRSLYPFQREGARFLALARDAILADEMGLGKTVQALVALPEKACGIVVAPNSLVHGWCKEAAIWRPDLKFEPVDRQGLRGVIAGEFIVATPDAVRIHHQRQGLKYNSGEAEPGSYVILDEAHLYKNPEAARTESIRRMSTYFDVCWVISGTPLANKPVDLWGTLSSVNLALRMFGSRDEFDRIFGGVKDKHGAYFWAKKPVDPDALRNAFRGRSLRRLRRVVAPEIPEKTYSVIHHSAPPELTSDCRVALGRFVEGSLDEKFNEPVARVQRRLAESKIPTMFETVDRFVASGDALVVFCSNVGPLEALADKYGCDLITGKTSMANRSKAVDEFQAGTTKLIGLQIQAGGVGITLTAAHHLLFVQRDWSPANSDQAEDRICRLGQKSTCVIYDIFSDHELDQIIRRVLASKARLMAATASAMPSTFAKD